MKGIITFLIAGLLSTANAQCPDYAITSAENQCIGVVWFIEIPDPMPDTIYRGELYYVYLTGIGNNIANAAIYTMYGDITEPLECASDIGPFTGTLVIGEQSCYFDGGPLPLTLTRFDATQDENHVKIQWATSVDLTDMTYHVERSTNAINWMDLDYEYEIMASADVIDYALTDKFPEHGKNYYRLRCMGLEGDFEYSNMLCVNFIPTARVYPNPATTQLHVRGDFELYDYYGRLVAKGNNRVIDVSGIIPGVYIIKIGDAVERVMIF